MRRPGGNSKLVVVIDDDPLVLEATAGLLSKWGCDVVAAPSYQEALGQLSAHHQRPDLIICDYRLGNGDNGADAIEDLRSMYEIPAVLISADPDNPERLGDCFWLQKPVDPLKFRDALVGASVLRR